MPKHYNESLSTSTSEEVSKVESKAKRHGKSEPFIEQRTKRDICHDTGKPTIEDRTVDRENDKYKKVVKDSNNGEVIYICDEPLSKHINRGSAKLRDAVKQKQSNAEKSISLKPLKFDEAVSDLLKVKPEPKEKHKNDKTSNK